MGSQRPAERFVRCDSIGLALPRVRSTPHNIGGLPPYRDLGQKNSNPLTSLFCASCQRAFSTDGLADRSAYGQIIMGSRCAPNLCLALMAPSSAPHNQLLPIRQLLYAITVWAQSSPRA